MSVCECGLERNECVEHVAMKTMDVWYVSDV